MACLCSIVPPFLLEGIANSETNPKHIRAEAQVSLDHHRRLAKHRNQQSFAHAEQHTIQQSSQQPNSFIPQDILKQLSQSTGVDVTTPASANKDPALLTQQAQT